MNVYGQYGIMLGLAEHFPELFPPGSSSAPKPVFEIGETSSRPRPKEVRVSSVHSDAVDSLVWSVVESDEESTTLEAEDDSDREDPPEVIPKESDEILLTFKENITILIYYWFFFLFIFFFEK